MSPYGHLARLSMVWEATARKIGNVHPGARFVDIEYMDFLRSAMSVSWDVRSLSYRMLLGGLIYESVQSTRCSVTSNTNLGMILLLAPLVLTAESDNYHAALVELLASTDVRDTQLLYKAIRIASPGGLGDAPEQDIRNEPTVTLLEAMRLAADRDMIARQYANGFADVFDFGVPAFTDAFARFGCVEAAVVDSQLRWLAAYPDSLIARKNGSAIAEDVQKRAAEVLRLGGIATPEGRAAGVALDKHLRSDGNKLNPGTTADLITACLFVALRENKVFPSAPFRWDVPDWL